MRGYLVPAGGGPALNKISHILDEREVIKAAVAKAHRDSSVRAVTSTMRKLAAGEEAAVMEGSLAEQYGPDVALQELREQSDRTVGSVLPPEGEDGALKRPVAPDKGLGREDVPAGLQRAYEGLHEEQEKEAFLRPLLALGRRGAAALARRGGRLGRVGSFLQRPIQSPLQVAGAGPGAVVGRVRSPLGQAPIVTSSPIPRPGAAAGRTKGPFREPGEVKSWTRPAKRRTKGQPSQEPPTRGVKPKGLIRSLLPGALLAGGAYAAYKGVPAALRGITAASHHPMAYNFGYKQYQYGYSPEGQAQF
jgi:hypothetical protein